MGGEGNIVFDFVEKIRQFRGCEAGAITVDFVVLTASIVLLGAIVVSTFDDEVIGMANTISETVRNQEPVGG